MRSTWYSTLPLLLRPSRLHLYCGPSYSLVLLILQAFDYWYADISLLSSALSLWLLSLASTCCQAFDLSLPYRCAASAAGLCCAAPTRLRGLGIGISRPHVLPRAHRIYSPTAYETIIYILWRMVTVVSPSLFFFASSLIFVLLFTFCCLWHLLRAHWVFILWLLRRAFDDCSGVRFISFDALLDLFIEQAGQTGSPAYEFYITMD